jgi:O-antigen ligase
MAEATISRIDVDLPAWLLVVARVLVCAMPVLFVLGKAPPDIALSLVGVLFLLRSGISRDWSWLRTPWVTAAACVWLYLIVVSFAAEQMAPSFGRAIPWIRFVVFAAAFQHWVITDETWRKRLLVCTGALVAFVAVDTIYQFFSGADIFGFPTYGPVRMTGPMHELPPKVGMFVTKLMFPVLLALVCWATLVRRNLGAVIVAIAAVGVGLSSVLISGERMALLLALLGLAVSLLVLPGSKRMLIAAALAIGLVLAGIAALSESVYTRSFASTVETIEDIGESHYGRIWQSSFRMAKARPLFGFGLKNFRTSCPNGIYGPYIDDPDGTLYLEAYGPDFNKPSRCTLHPHNMYVEWLTESGAVGLAGFLWLIGLWMRHFILRADSWRRDPMAVGTVVGVLVFLWPVASTMSFFTNWHGGLFWFVLGWALAATSITPANRPVS